MGSLGTRTCLEGLVAYYRFLGLRHSSLLTPTGEQPGSTSTCCHRIRKQIWGRPRPSRLLKPSSYSWLCLPICVLEKLTATWKVPAAGGVCQAPVPFAQEW